MLKCPQCKKDCPYDPGNPHRPFCSDRCRLLDLGAWAEEAYTVPLDHEMSEPNSDEIEKEDDEDAR